MFRCDFSEIPSDYNVFLFSRSSGNATDGQIPAATTLKINSAMIWSVLKQHWKKPGLLVFAEQVAINSQMTAFLVQNQDLRKILV